MTDLGNHTYTFEIPLPNNPLRWLNSYVLKSPDGSGRNLLIDTGFHMPECAEALAAGIKELGLSPENTDVYITHMHSDHSGNADVLAGLGYKIMMRQDEYNRLTLNPPGGLYRRGLMMGIPEDVLNDVLVNMPGTKYAPDPFPITPVSDGQILEYGGRRLEVLVTPGHTPGNTCLYDAANKTIFCGDHVLFDITPNIVSWLGVEDSLGLYLENLRRVQKLDVVTAYPAHRTTGGKTFYGRIDELIAHHEARLEETRKMSALNPGATAHDIAALVKWKIRARDWSDFPPGQKWFAVGECLAHLEYLQARGLERIEADENNVLHFWAV